MFVLALGPNSSPDRPALGQRWLVRSRLTPPSRSQLLQPNAPPDPKSVSSLEGTNREECARWNWNGGQSRETSAPDQS